ncbi:TPA: hypothetical protein ACGIK9_003255 [Acinetobacter baumannii]|uniref:hypothetical protein n=1 Tax=Acinetobacter baumannii TaxID=470 RepID=UPI0033903253
MKSKFLGALLVSLVLSGVVCANKIAFQGTVSEYTCSSDSKKEGCSDLYKLLESKYGKQESIANVSKALQQQKNELATLDVKQVDDRDKSKAVVNVEYF